MGGSSDNIAEVPDSGEKDSLVENGKYVRYSNEQVEALERVYNECPKPSSMRRTQLIKECPILSNIEPKQIKVWFQNRRCRERQRNETGRLQNMNTKLAALNKLLVEENELATNKINHLTMENAMLRSQLSTFGGSEAGSKMDTLLMAQATNTLARAQGGALQDPLFRQDPNLDHTLEMRHLAPGEGPETTTSGLLSIAEEILGQFLSKATSGAHEFVEVAGLKLGSDFMGRVTLLPSGPGVAARAVGLVAMEPGRAADLLKDRMQWLRECRRCDVLGGFRTGPGGSVELIYTQMYAPTTLAAPRDFCTLRYTSPLEGGGVAICERSLSAAHGGATMPAVPSFCRAEMLPSGYLIRPCEGGGCVVVAVDHQDLQPGSVPEVLRPLYDSSAMLAQRLTVEALRFLQRTAADASGSGIAGGSGAQVAAWRAIAERIAAGLNEAVNAFEDDHWVPLPTDGLDDVSVAARSTRPGENGGNMPPAVLIRFLRDHRSEWADGDIDATSAAAVRASLARRGEGNGGQLPLPIAYAVDSEEFLELVKLDPPQGSTAQTFLLQLCSGVDDLAVGPAQLVFAPVDAASSAECVPLLPSGFRVLPLHCPPAPTRDLAAALEGQQTSPPSGHRSVLTIAFQFVYEGPARDAVAKIGRLYVRSVVASVQRVAQALAPTPAPAPAPAPASAKVVDLSHSILVSYARFVGSPLVRQEGTSSREEAAKAYWDYPDAIICVAPKQAPEFLFANKAGLEMMETNSGGLGEVVWNATYDDSGRKAAYMAFAKVMQTGVAYLPPGLRISKTRRGVAYERGVAWKVVDEDNTFQCCAFMHCNWAFIN